MKMLARGLAALGLIVVTAAGAEVRNVHFALTASIAEGTSLAGTGMLIGIGTRVDFELKGPFAVSPEIDWFQYWGPLVPACILNCRFGKGYLGMGPMVAWTDGSAIGLIKANLGIRGRHSLVEVLYIAGGASPHTGGERTALIGLTLGVVF